MNVSLPNDFLTLSKRIGSDPLLVQGPGGNTSMKREGEMWIKASGTLLSDAAEKDIFVAVDPAKAIAELDGAGDGSCRSALVDPDCGLRPSIETTFHAMLPQRFVFHFHSVATICHAITDIGRQQLTEKLDGLNWVSAPYRKPGIPLSQAIRESVGGSNANVIVLENHGLIVAGETIDAVAALIDDVEQRLNLPILQLQEFASEPASFDGWNRMSDFSALACDLEYLERATAGTYYPDHVVFLGPAMPVADRSEMAKRDVQDFPFPAVLVPGGGVFAKADATSAQVAMVRCLFDVLTRIPADWSLLPIGESAEAELLNWDAEKYRQMLTKRSV